MQAYVKFVVDDVATEGVLPRHRYQLLCNLLRDGKLCREEQTWIERLCYGVSNNLLPLVD
ncbi:MAG: hypothetical protein WBB82_14270 [Limnothrix sp.]